MNLVKKISKEFPIRNRWIYDRNNGIKFELPGQTAAAFYKNFYMNFTKKQLKSYMECSTNGENNITKVWMMIQKIIQKSFSNFKGKKIVKSEKEIY